MQSTLHVAIIMDGNGRWAAERGLLRTEGHRRGAVAVRRTVEAAAANGVGYLTLYAFSSDNWRRPASEVATLMRLFREYLVGEAAECATEGIRLNVIGRRDRLDGSLTSAIEGAESSTADGTRMLLRIAVDYSSRDAIISAAERSRGVLTRDAFDRGIAFACHADPSTPPVDLLIRTGREKRLSDFLLWESAYAELWFTDVMWPEFEASHLVEALAAFRGRERRFGGLVNEDTIVAGEAKRRGIV